MATKKATEETIQEVEEVKAAEPKSKWDEKESILVPRKPKGEDQQYYVCVNDRRYIVPANNKTQELPKPIAEALKQALEDEYEADKFIDGIPNNEPAQPELS